MFKHVISVGDEARSKFLKGAEKARDIIGSTLGPKGQNLIIEDRGGFPMVHNDGANVARKIVLDDPIEDLAFQVIVDVAMKQNEQVGDGTTTAVLLASNILITGFKHLNTSIVGADPVGYGELILEEGKRVIELLKKEARPLKKDELINVITTSLRDREFAKVIGEMVNTLGKDSYISVEDNWKTNYGIMTETITGIKKLGSYASPFFVNSKNKKEAVWEDTHILVTNHKLESGDLLNNILLAVKNSGKLRLVIVNGYSEDTTQYAKPLLIKLLANIQAANMGNAKDLLEILPIKSPALISEELEDIAAFTGAKFIDKNKGHNLLDVKLSDLGLAKKVVVDEDEFLMVDGRGNVKDRLKTLNDQLPLEKDTMFKEKLKRRIASLSAGAGLIRVGAVTEAERSFLKMKIEDAVNTAKAAVEEGVIIGGGIVLQKIAKELGKDSVLYEPLMSVNETIVKNAGGNLKIGKDVLDAVKVTRLAVESACSAASKVISSGGGIAKKKRTLIDEMEKLIAPRDEDDARDDSNYDKSSPRAMR